MKTNSIRVALLVVLSSALLSPEISWNLQGGTIRPKRVPTVTFTWSWSTANPPYYSIAITPMGNVTYESFPNSDRSTGKPYTLEFTATRGFRTRVSSLVEQLNFFRGKYNIKQNPDPRVASKSLTYGEGVARSQITYTSTNDHRIRQLTELFENMSATVNEGRQLGLLRAGNLDSMDAELRRLASENNHGKVPEPQILIPVLQQIASDSAAPARARQDAQTILREIPTR